MVDAMNEPSNDLPPPRKPRPAAPEFEPAAPRRVRPDAPVAPARAPDPKAKSARSSSLFLQRTIIPILLTMCALSFALAAGWTTLDADSPFREFGKATPLILLFTGVLCGISAAVNMISVRRALANRPR
jgi:hypothetical protein